MANWEMSCSCGDTMQMDGETKDAAVDKLMALAMTPEAITAHMTEKHAGEPTPTVEQARAGLLASARQI